MGKWKSFIYQSSRYIHQINIFSFFSHRLFFMKIYFSKRNTTSSRNRNKIILLSYGYNKRKKYQKKTDKQHILDNPDTYIGSIIYIHRLLGFYVFMFL